MNDIVVFVVFFLIYFLLIKKAGDTYPVFPLLLFTFFVQYIFSTYLIYNDFVILKNYMPISQKEYFDYAVPAMAFFFAGIFVFDRNLKIVDSFKRIDPHQAERLGYLLFIISYFFDFTRLVGVSAVSSIMSFTTYLKYVGAFCFLFTNSRVNYLLIAVAYFQLMFQVLGNSVFIDFFVWSTFLFFFIAIKFRFSFWIRASFILVAVPVLLLVQSVKEEYRNATWNDQREGGIELFTELAQKKEQEDEQFAKSDAVTSTVGRLSQGWHLAKALKHVPAVEPVADGEEMVSDVVASFLPRFLFSDKKTVGSQEKFFKYTGHKLRGGTSMTIGVLGDFYINYGQWGSYVMLFVFGACIAMLLHYFLVHYVIPEPINVVWIPFMLSNLIRANNDFYNSFNCIVKGFLIFLIVNFISKRT